MITNLSLKNWKSHIDSSFDFSEGVNCVIGNMGSGKSSIMQAISFALFGTFPALHTKKIKLDDLIMKKPENQKTAQVSLTIENNGKKYNIIRKIEIGKGTTYAEISEDGKQLNVNPAAVNAEVQRILQIDYELFSKAVYSEQNGLDYFLRIPKGHRMQQIDKMLKVDRFESSRENTVKIKNKLLYQNEEKIKTVTELERKDLEKRTGELRAEIRRMVREKSLFGVDLKQFSDTKNKLEEQLSKFDEKNKRLNDVDKELASVEATFFEMKNNLEEIKKKTKDKTVEGVLREKENIDRDIKFSEKNISDNKNFVNMLREETASLNTTIFDLEKIKIPEDEKKIQDQVEQKNKLDQIRRHLEEENLEEKKKNLEEYTQNNSNMCAKQEDTIKQIAELESAKAVCPTCSKELTEEHREHVLKEKKSLLEGFHVDIEKNSKYIEELKKDIDLLENNRQELSLLEERVKDLDSVKTRIDESRKIVEKNRQKVNDNVKRMQTIESSVKESEEKLILMRENFVELKNLVDVVEKLDEQSKKINEYSKKSRSLAQEKALIENAVKSIDIEEIKKRYKNALAREAEMQVKILSIDELLKEKQTRLSEIEIDYDKMKRYQDEISEDRAIINNLDTFVTVLRATQDQLREEFLKTVNNVMNDIWTDLYPYDDFEEIKLSIDDGDYSLQLKSIDGWANIEGIVSGGERSLACLALRIAFSMAFIPNLKWLILDEPTHNLDDNAIAQFAEILREKVHNFANQVFLITHEDKISEGVTGQFYRLERRKELNEPTRVVRF
ncbi:MAG: SMC family ATPase [Nanoarchaeota archaeon]|nr:SMC family ATPase [Nanoarchaeota archaeon]MBU1135249.1 SMC family ATPase [Nanoarchaeota archaeon]MBU2519901.1 SMC family ATPase [Nanoarchaeota archaeon]